MTEQTTDTRLPPSAGVGVVDTSAFWATWRYLKESTDDVSVDEFARTPQLFVSFLHSLILFEHIRTDVEVAGEQDWYADGVREVVLRLKPLLPVDSMPPIEREKNLPEEFANLFVHELEKLSTEVKSGSIFSMPWFYYKRGLRPGTSDEKIYRVLMERIDRSRATQALAYDDRLMLAANGAFVFRGMCYAGHAHYLSTVDGIPSAYSASAARVGAMARFLDSTSVTGLPVLQSNYFDLIDKLSLPQTGYDFSFLGGTLAPLKRETLTAHLLSLKPSEALERVMSIRDSAEGRRIREIWAARLWGVGRSCVEGGTTLENVVVHGDVVQVVGVARPIGPENAIRQKVSLSRVDGSVEQIAITPSRLTFETSEALDL